MLILHSLPGDATFPSHSPFCMKAAGLLNLSGQAWQMKWVNNPGQGPYGKMPVLQDGAKMIPETAFIQAHLAAKGADLQPSNTALAHSLTRMVENGLLMGLLFDRWLDDANWAVMRDKLFAAMPGLIRPMVAGGIRKGMRKGLQQQGFGRLSAPDRLRILQLDLDAIDQVLGDKLYLTGDQATAVDTAVSPVLAMALALPTPTDFTRAIQARPLLHAYADRCLAQLFTLPK